MYTHALSLPEVTQRTARLIEGMMTFWKSSKGWAPIGAAELLTKSMLDWQSSLAASLSKWTGAVRVNAIGGGAEEILRDLAARQLGG